ncbi:hypothetical protein ACFE04_021106 [Oxalis oulophora]
MEVIGQTSMTHLTKYTKVEVLTPDSDADIFKRAYFPATIIDTPPWLTRNRHSNNYLVQYDNFLSSDGAKPLPPSRAYNPFELNDIVDVYHLHRWTVCVVDKVMCKEEGKEYRVRFDQNPSSHYIDVAHDFLRPHFDWVGGKWVPLKIPKKEPSFGPRIENVTWGSLRRMKKADGNGQCFANSRKSPSEKSDVYTKETSLDVAFPSKLAQDQEKKTEISYVKHSAPDSLPLDVCNQNLKKTRWDRDIRGETVITNDVDVTHELPFVKMSALWEVFESHEVFQKTPQKPHFSPLAGKVEALREGYALGTMVNFSNLMIWIGDLRYGDPERKFDIISESLPELEEHGFDVEPITTRLEQLRSMKGKFGELEVGMRETESHIIDREHEKSEMVKKFKELKEQIADKDSEISNLRLTLTTIHGRLEAARQAFQNMAAGGTFEEDE